MKNKILVNYVCEVNYPSSSAYGIHVLKMCDSLINKNTKVNLFAPNISISKQKLKNIYNIKNNINYISIFNKQKNLNFYERVIFSFKVFNQKNYKISKNNEKNLQSILDSVNKFMGWSYFINSEREQGATVAVPIWIDFMRKALTDEPETTINRPDGIVDRLIDRSTGRPATPGDPNAIFEYFRAENDSRNEG